MARFSAILVPATGTTNNGKVTVGAGASSAAQSLGKDQIFSIQCSAAANMRMGTSSVSDATVNDIPIPANTPLVFDTGAVHTHVKVFSTAGCDFYITPLSAAH
jgi:hypothetical protein